MPYKVEITKVDNLETLLNCKEMDGMSPIYVFPVQFLKRLIVVFFRPFILEQLQQGGINLNKMIMGGGGQQPIPPGDKNFGFKKK